MPVVLSAVMAIVATLLLHQYGIAWPEAIVDGNISAIVFGMSVSGGIFTVNSYPTRAGIAAYAFLAGIGFGFIAWYFDLLVLKWWFVDDAIYMQG